MAKTSDTTIPASAIEMPPNKANTAGGVAVGTTSLGSIAVGLALYYFAPDTPPHVAGMWDALVNGVFVGASVWFATYYTPHGAMIKDN